MDNDDIFRPRQSIRTRLLSLIIGLTTASVVIIAYLGVSSILRTGQSAQQLSSARLRSQSQEYLVQLTVVTAERNDQFFQQARQDVENVAQYAAAIFDHPQAFSSQGYWLAKDHMFRGPEGQYINGKDDVSSVFVPNSVKVDDAFIAQMELDAYLDFVFIPVHNSSPDRGAIYFISKNEHTRLYPNLDLGSVNPPDFLGTQEVFFTAAAPAQDPNRQVVWTPVYDDPAGQGLLVTAVAPVYNNQGEFLGIIGLDISLARLSSAIEATSPIAGGYSFLVNNEGRAIALPKQGYSDILNREPKPGESGPDLRATTGEFAPVLTSMMSGSKGSQIVQAGNRELLVAYAPLANTHWSLATVAPTETILQTVADLQKELNASTQSLVVNGVVPIGGAILIIATVLGLLLTNRLVNPLQRLATAAQEIGAGNWDTTVPQTGNDEIGVLARAFSMMTAQIRELVSSLEQRVAERTREVERRADQIATGAEISRVASQELDPGRLLPAVVNLIRERFDLYYVAVFLTDEFGRNAVLRAGTGEAGQAMLERGHKLEVGSHSMVGWVCTNKKARIALDVGDEPVRFANPLLPLTRSEIALPLHIGERIIGALDIQSTRAQAFDQNDITALQGMADQIAVALENARLFQQVQASLQEVAQVNRLLTGQGWQSFMLARPADFAEFHQASLEPIRPEETERLFADDDADRSRRISIPLLVRDEMIGALMVERAPDQPAWSDADRILLEAISAQAAQAIDSVRLFEESQRLAAREQIIGQVAARVRETLDVDAVIKMAAQETRRALNLPQVIVRLVPPAEPAPGNGHGESKEARQ